MAEQPNQLRRAGDEAPDQVSAISGSAVRPGDRIFRGLSVGASASVLVIMAAIAAFLIYQAIPALREERRQLLHRDQVVPGRRPWPAGDLRHRRAGRRHAGLQHHRDDHRGAGRDRHRALHQLLRAAAAGEAARATSSTCSPPCPRSSSACGASPSSRPPGRPGALAGPAGSAGPACSHYRPDADPGNQSLFTAGLVLAIMILPIISAITREVFRAGAAATNIEAALALGATRWEMIRIAVLPFGRGRRHRRPRSSASAARSARRSRSRSSCPPRTTSTCTSPRTAASRSPPTSR